MLEKEYKFYQNNQKKLVDKYLNKHIVIKDDKVVGAYSSMDEAITKALESFELGTFLVKLVEKEEQVVRFYNRVFV